MKLLVFLLLPCLSLSEVVPGFANCKHFFLEDVPPAFPIHTRVEVKEICQCVSYNDNNNKKQIMYVYATLYSTTWRIPIYSAYVFNGNKNVRSVGRCDVWYIEPQLDEDGEQCMASQGHNRKIGNNQAVNCDYKEKDTPKNDEPKIKKPKYEKGHLYPVQHTNTHLSMLATSTLTNAAPQDSEFNQNQWREHEKAVIDELTVCDKAYVVTGVVPDTNIKIPKGPANVDSKSKQKYERVTVSKYYWRAYCCVKKNSRNELVYTGKGYFGPDGEDKSVKELSIKALQDKLAKDYGVQITIFPSRPNLPEPPPTPVTPQLSGHKRPRPYEIEIDECID